MVDDYYDFIADGYDELHKSEQLRKLGLMVSWLKARFKSDPGFLSPSSKVLDVGCGTGFSLDFLHNALGLSVVGVEPSVKMASKYKGSHEIIIGRAESLPFPDNSFRIVVSVTAIQNFDDVLAGVGEMKRVSEPGALLLISVLKKSSKLKLVSEVLADYFVVLDLLEDDADIIFFCKNL